MEIPKFDYTPVNDVPAADNDQPVVQEEKPKKKSKKEAIPISREDAIKLKDIKKVDEIKKDVESFTYLKKPFEKWSSKEKRNFVDWFNRHFNNYWAKAGIALLGKYDKSGDKPIKKDYSRDEAISTHEFSEKYYSGTRNQFYRDIRQVLLDCGANISNLRERYKQTEKSQQNMIGNHELFDDAKKLEEFRKICDENDGPYYVALITAFPVLITMGYSLSDIKR